MEALQVMQNKAARLVTNSEQGASRKAMYKQIGWMTVNQLSFDHSALTTFRIRKSQEPEYLNNILNRNNRADKVIIPNTDLTLAMKSYCFRGTVYQTELERIQESANSSLN